MNTHLHYLPPAYVKEHLDLNGIQEFLCPFCLLLHGGSGSGLPKQVNRTSEVLAEIRNDLSEGKSNTSPWRNICQVSETHRLFCFMKYREGSENDYGVHPLELGDDVEHGDCHLLFPKDLKGGWRDPWRWGRGSGSVAGHMRVSCRPCGHRGRYQDSNLLDRTCLLGQRNLSNKRL